MKKPVVDYRQFRLRKLNTPEFSHLKLLLIGWGAYFALYFLTENLIPLDNCHVIHRALDDRIPFCELFVIPYVLWYLLVAGSLLYFGLYDIPSFKKLQTFIMITQAIAMTAYILYPSRQDLRPEVFPRENFLTWGMSIIYAFDTPSGVCPSLHVAYSLGIASVWCKKKDVAPGWKIALVVFILIICLATAFVKQHSVVDIFWALPVGLIAEIALYGKSWWLPRLRGEQA